MPQDQRAAAVKCFASAEDYHRRALEARDPEIKAYCERMESVWRYVANRYEPIESVDS
jgi:hypothetical protein